MANDKVKVIVQEHYKQETWVDEQGFKITYEVEEDSIKQLHEKNVAKAKEMVAELLGYYANKIGANFAKVREIENGVIVYQTYSVGD